jgi:signal transduction histidine kinase
LMSALKQRAGELEDLFQISCRFECEKPVLIDDVNAATHLYHIAQEASFNAIKHGKAKNVVMTLTASGDAGRLMVQDDGCGFSGVPTDHPGMGLNIMRYRAKMVGGSVEVSQNLTGGTTVSCVFPIQCQD